MGVDVGVGVDVNSHAEEVAPLPHLLVDLVPPPDGLRVQGGHRPVVAPRQLGRVQRQLRLDRVLQRHRHGHPGGRRGAERRKERLPTDAERRRHRSCKQSDTSRGNFKNHILFLMKSMDDERLLKVF